MLPRFFSLLTKILLSIYKQSSAVRDWTQPLGGRIEAVRQLAVGFFIIPEIRRLAYMVPLLFFENDRLNIEIGIGVQAW